MAAVRTDTLYVDLDGTLTLTDVLVEAFLELIKKNLLYLLILPFWLLRGKAYMKHQIMQRVSLRVDLLPYNQELLDYLRQQKQQGSKLVLISASTQSVVDQIAEHLALFDAAIGSSISSNCSGHRKLARIREHSGDSSFVYAGNAEVDLQVWRQAQGAILVNTSAALKKRAAASTAVVAVFDNKYNAISGMISRSIKAMRPHQWLKNTLLFLPLMLAHQVDNTQLVWQAVIAFVSFSLCSSSVYVLNDLLDLSADRQHRTKCRRPFAAGHLSPLTGLLLSAVLLAFAFGFAAALPVEFMLILAVYYLCTGMYSFVLKKIELVDVITLATLYTLRIIAGAAAVSVIPSFWLLAFSMFLFMSLAIVKRYTELSYLRESGITHSAGRGYVAKDLDMLAIFGCISGLMSVMVFALYINSDDILEQYSTPEILWFICPLLLYLVSRIWLLAFRGEIEEDPIIFALTDSISQSVTVVCITLLWMANLNWNLY